MDKKNNRKLIIDLRRDCDFTQNPIPSRFKIVMVGYYIIFGVLVGSIVFTIANIAIVKRRIASIKIEEKNSTIQMCAIQNNVKTMELRIQKANKLIEWLADAIHGQELLNILFSDFSKEVVLEKFSLKKDPTTPQILLSINLKGGHHELHNEFEILLSKLELIGLRLITLTQSEILGGIHLKCICQLNELENRKR